MSSDSQPDDEDEDDYDEEFDEEEYGEDFSIGDNPSFRYYGFLGGIALIALAAFLAINLKIRRLVFWIAITGLGVLAYSFRNRGLKFEAEGLRTWSYFAWFIGRRRMLPASNLRAFVLGHHKDKFILTVHFHDGGSYRLPEKFTAVNDARNIMNLAKLLYKVEEEVDIDDASKLAEIQAFDQAPRLPYTITKSHRSGFSVALLIQNVEEEEDDEEEDEDSKEISEDKIRIKELVNSVLGELAIDITRPYFGRSRAEFEDSDGQNWVLVKSWGRDQVQVQCGAKAWGEVEVNRGFWGKTVKAQWNGPNNRTWWAAFKGGRDWDPVSIKFYNEDPDQGGAVVALLDGDDDDGSLDVADPSVCPWIAVSLGAMLLAHGKEVSP